MTNQSDNFMLKEYEKLYDLYKIHYDYADKMIKNFLLVIGAFLSIVSFVYKDNYDSIDLYDFNQLVEISLYITSIACTSIYLMLLENRIKLIYYVRSVNNIRKWAVSKNTDIKQFLSLPSDPSTPKYFRWFKGFFWELFAFGLLNSIIVGLSILHLLRSVINIKDVHCHVVYFGLIISLSALHLIVYRNRGSKDNIVGMMNKENTDSKSEKEPPLNPNPNGDS